MTAQSYVLGLSISYALLGALAVTILSGTRLGRGYKRAAIVSIGGLYIATFYWLEGLLGWSAPVRLPAKFQLLWARVVEPNAIRSEPGVVHLWIEELDDANLPSGLPRAYRLPYSPPLAAKAVAAQSEIRKGHPQGGMTTTFGTGLGQMPPGGETPMQGVSPGGDPSGGGLLDPEFLGGQSKTVDLVPLPAPILPAKDDP
jgi:hypothetical protein